MTRAEIAKQVFFSPLAECGNLDFRRAQNNSGNLCSYRVGEVCFKHGKECHDVGHKCWDEDAGMLRVSTANNLFHPGGRRTAKRWIGGYK